MADVWDELAEAVSTPSANPVISLTPTATPTSTPELGLLERMR